MTMRRKITGIMMIGLSVSLLSGCWDSKELNNQALQIGTGLDLSEDGEIVLSNQFALNTKGPSSEANAQQQSYTEVAKGANVFNASAKMQNRVTRTINRGQRTSIAIGERLARQGIREVIDIYTRTPEAQLRNDVFIVKKGLAADFLKSTTPFGSLSQREYYKLHQTQNEVADVTLMNMIRFVNTHSPSGAIVPAMEHVTAPFANEQDQKKEMQYAYTGVGVLTNDLKLVGYLNNEETSLVLWVLGRAHRQFLATKVPEEPGLISAQLRNLKSRIQPVFGDQLEFRVAIGGNAEIKENSTNLDLLKTDNVELVEKALEEHTQEQLSKLIKKVQTRYKTDILYFGDTIFRKYPRHWRSLESQWASEFPEIPVSVKVNIKVRRIGLTGAPVQLKNEEIQR